jgi:hypothetical protein
LFTPLIGCAGVVRLRSHGHILADKSDLGICLYPIRALVDKRSSF